VEPCFEGASGLFLVVPLDFDLILLLDHRLSGGASAERAIRRAWSPIPSAFLPGLGSCLESLGLCGLHRV